MGSPGPLNLLASQGGCAASRTWAGLWRLHSPASLSTKVGNDVGLSCGHEAIHGCDAPGLSQVPRGPSASGGDYRGFGLTVDTGHHLPPGLTVLCSVPQCTEFGLKCQSCLEHMLDTLLHELP